METKPSCPYHVCGCIGYGYVPVQELGDLYTVEKGLNKGTIFPELALGIEDYGYVCLKYGGAQ